MRKIKIYTEFPRVPRIQRSPLIKAAVGFEVGLLIHPLLHCGRWTVRHSQLFGAFICTNTSSAKALICFSSTFSCECLESFKRTENYISEYIFHVLMVAHFIFIPDFFFYQTLFIYIKFVQRNAFILEVNLTSGGIRSPLSVGCSHYQKLTLSG